MLWAVEWNVEMISLFVFLFDLSVQFLKKRVVTFCACFVDVFIIPALSTALVSLLMAINRGIKTRLEIIRDMTWDVKSEIRCCAKVLSQFLFHYILETGNSIYYLFKCVKYCHDCRLTERPDSPLQSNLKILFPNLGWSKSVQLQMLICRSGQAGKLEES